MATPGHAVSKSQLIQVPVGFRDSETPALRLGEVVDSTFQIMSFLSRGETGAVYEARDMLLDRLVALKLAWRDSNAPRLLPEARQCSTIAGPPAAAIYALGNHQGTEYVVAERVLGERLSELLVRAPLPDAEVVAIWRAVVEAMAMCHAAGMAVGDVSGSSVLLFPPRAGVRRVVLGRFSMSQVPAIGPHGRIFAPEVIQGQAGPDDPMAAEAIDLYSLGAVAMELATGKPLFYDPELEHVLRGHVDRAPPTLLELRPDLPPELSDLVDWLLVKEPDARPPSVAEVLLQLDAVIERSNSHKPPLRILVVDSNPARGRWLASLVRRANPRTLVAQAPDGADASAKAQAELPDLLLVDATLGGSMNALELGMYVRSLENQTSCKIAVLGEASPGNQAVLELVGATMVNYAPSAIVQFVRALAEERASAERPRRARRRSGVLG